MIFGIAGKAYAGKDTFGRLLAEELNKIQYPPYVLMSFAHELKLRIQKDFDLSYEQLWGNKKEVPDDRYKKPNSSEFWTPREMMQSYGEFYRSIDYDFWVKSLMHIIDEKEYTNVIITDVRHPNEAVSVKDKGGFLIRIVRDGNIVPHGITHISETALDGFDGFDAVIDNNGTLEDLKQGAISLVKVLQNLFPEFKSTKTDTVVGISL